MPPVDSERVMGYVRRLDDALDKIHAGIGGYQARENALRERNEACERSLRENHAEYDGIFRGMNEEYEGSLRGMNEEYERRLQSVDEEYETKLQSVNEAHERSLQGMNEEYEMKLQSVNEAHAGILRGMNDVQHGLERGMDELRRQLGECHATITKQNAALVAEREQSGQCAVRVGELESALEQANARVKEQERQLREGLPDDDAYNTLQQDYVFLKGRYDTIAAENMGLKNSLEVNAGIRQQLEQSNEENARIMEVLEESRAENQRLDEELTQQKSIIEAFKEEVESKNKRIHDLELEVNLSKPNETNNEESFHMRDEQERVAECEDKLDQANLIMDEQQNRMQLLIQENTTLRENNQRLQENQTNIESIRQLHKNLDVAERKNQLLLERNEKLFRDNEDSLSQLQRIATSHKEKVSGLEKERNAIVAECEAQELEFSRVNDMLIHERQKNDKMKTLLQAKEEQINDCDAEFQKKSSGTVTRLQAYRQRAAKQAAEINQLTLDKETAERISREKSAMLNELASKYEKMLQIWEQSPRRRSKE